MPGNKAFEQYKIAIGAGSAKVLDQPHATIAKFLNEKDIPSWYRTTSIYQKKAADNMIAAIRDDLDQGTTHRVRECLSLIGIQPIVSDTSLKHLMTISRSDDIAFLYFLLEGHYKTKGDVYNINEQLILSTICHLDMVTTLRGLDRVLPPGTFTLKELENRKIKNAKKNTTGSRESIIKPPFKNSNLPYFQILKLPKPYGKPLIGKEALFTASLGQYEIYSDENYVVPNEKHRWYSDLATANLTTYQKNRMLDYADDLVEIWAKRTVHQIIDNIFKNSTLSIYKADTAKTICAHHKTVQLIEESLKRKLNEIAKNQCFEHFNVNTKKASKKRVMERLENDVELFMTKFRKFANKSVEESLVLLLCNDQKNFDLEKLELCSLRSRESVKTVDHLKNIKTVDSRCPCFDNKQIKQFGQGDGLRTYKGVDPKKSENVNKKLNNKMSATSKNKDKKQIYLKEQPIELEKAESSVGGSKSLSGGYFYSATESKPYRFNYHKIFEPPKKDTKSERVKREFLNALKADVSFVNEVQDENDIDLDLAVSTFMKQRFQQLVKEKNEIPPINHKYPSGYEDGRFYDCNNKTLMLKMLQDGLACLAKNAKYVLAALPDSYKIPLLFEWIIRRYGKKYTKKEIATQCKMSQSLYRWLNTMSINVKAPRQIDISNKYFVDYSARDYVKKRSEQLRMKYYDRVKHAIMEQSRIFWYAVGPDHVAKDDGETYFSYVPSKPSDVYAYFQFHH